MLITFLQMFTHMIVYLNHLEGFTKLTQTLFIHQWPCTSSILKQSRHLLTTMGYYRKVCN
jgi:hypothetical protein